MYNSSTKQVRDIQALYEGIYQKEEEQNLSEEDICDILAIQICNALIEGGLLEGEIITEDSIIEGKLESAIKLAGNVIKQVTGLQTKPTSNLGRAIRQLQVLTTGASIANQDVPKKILSTIQGAIKGGIEGATGKSQQGQPSTSPQQRRRTVIPTGEVD
jgi:hypothetical protein